MVVGDWDKDQDDKSLIVLRPGLLIHRHVEEDGDDDDDQDEGRKEE